MAILTKDELRKMYHEDKLSMREIAVQVGATKGQIEHLMESLDIPRRSVTEAKKIKDCKEDDVRMIEAKQEVAILATKCKTQRTFKPTKRNNILIPYPIGENANRDATLTVVISDLHIGDSNHLPETYWSTMENAKVVINAIKNLYKVKEINLVLNGDIVSGRDVYRNQFLRNIIQRGHWQVFLAEIVLKDTIAKLDINVTNTYLVKGTHEGVGFNELLFLKRSMPGKTKYLSNGNIVNIAGCLGEYYVLFTHGYGYNVANPVSTGLINDVMKALNNFKTKGLYVDRICSSHSHWLSSGLVIDEIYWDVTGGFQKWEYTISQRPAGIIIYIYNNGECVSIPVRPNTEIEYNEKSDCGLEYKNITYYGKCLNRHLENIEEVW
jgi:hypothetical protein